MKSQNWMPVVLAFFLSLSSFALESEKAPLKVYIGNLTEQTYYIGDYFLSNLAETIHSRMNIKFVDKSPDFYLSVEEEFKYDEYYSSAPHPLRKLLPKRGKVIAKVFNPRNGETKEISIFCSFEDDTSWTSKQFSNLNIKPKKSCVQKLAPKVIELINESTSN